MKFLKSLFGRTSSGKKKFEIETDGESYIQIEKNAFIFNKETEPAYTYTDVSEITRKQIDMSVAFVKDAFAPLLQFSKQPSNHPENLDEYLTVWGSAGFDNFMNIDANQHAAFLAYNFGQYLVETYGMQWQVKSDGHGSATVVRIENPVEIELYPIDSTLRAVQNKDLAIYAQIEAKLKRALDVLQ